MHKLRKLLMLLLMLILPIQGIAAAFAPLYKAMHASSASAMPCHEQQKHPTHQTQDRHDSAQAAPSTVDEHAGGTVHDTDAANHLCCHHVYSCVPTRTLNTAAQKFSDVSRFVLPLATLFIPDSPDRPPRG